MWRYTQKVMDHFENPRNVGVIDGADGVGEVGSVSCGDALKLTLKLDDQNRIVDAKFQTFGCASAIASSSALTDMIIGLTLEEASKITNQDIVDFLGGLPKQKIHCSVMGQEALTRAIANARGECLPEDSHEEPVCECFHIAKNKIVKAISDNKLTTLDEITAHTKAGGGCCKCHDALLEALDSYRHITPESK